MQRLVGTTRLSVAMRVAPSVASLPMTVVVAAGCHTARLLKATPALLTAPSAVRGLSTALSSSSSSGATDVKAMDGRQQHHHRHQQQQRQQPQRPRLSAVSLLIAGSLAAATVAAADAVGDVFGGADETRGLSALNLLSLFDVFEEGIEFMTGAEGGEQNSAKGVDCLTRAADRGFAPAQQQLAMVYLTGDGVTRDDVKAVELLERAANQQDGEALFWLGTVISAGRADHKYPDRRAALLYWQRSADMQHPGAQFKLALCYMPTDPAATQTQGFRLPASEQSAELCLYWMQRAAASDMPEGKRFLSDKFAELQAKCTSGVVFTDFNQSVDSFKLFPIDPNAARTAADAHALYRAGLGFRLATPDSAEQKRALKALQKSADMGYAVAISELAAAQHLGYVTGKPDPVTAKRLFERAAAKGLSTAMFSLSSYYLDAKEMGPAGEWTARAAVRGEALAANTLGSMLCMGDPFAKDEDHGVRWISMAAMRGLPEAMYGMGQAYELGIGMDEGDIEVAAQWYARAVDHGVREAGPALERVKREIAKSGMTALVRSDAAAKQQQQQRQQLQQQQQQAKRS